MLLLDTVFLRALLSQSLNIVFPNPRSMYYPKHESVGPDRISCFEKIHTTTD